MMPADDSLQLMQGMMMKILPLYAIMALGFVFGRLRPQAAEPISFLQIYFMVPVIVVTSFANIQFQSSYLVLPIITYLICCAIGFVALLCGRRIWKDNTPNIFSYACSCANVGYYGLPVALLIFTPEFVGVFMMATLGFTLFESTLGYYWVARGHFTMRDSVRKLVRLPIIYAAVLGVVLSALGQRVPDFASDITRDFRGFYIVAGALMIGMGLARLKHLKIEFSMAAFVFTFKFLLWPLIILALITTDKTLTHLFSYTVYKVLMLLALMPMPANAVAYALQLNVQPERTSSLVFLSTLFALFYIPLVMALWG